MNEAKNLILTAIRKNRPETYPGRTGQIHTPDKIAGTGTISVQHDDNTQIPVHFHELPEIPVFPKSNKPLLDEFKENLVAGAGTWHEIKSGDNINVFIQTLHPDAKVICSAASEIKGNKDLRKITTPRELDDVDVGIIRAEFGVAETGMVWLTDEDLQVNALGFLSQHLIILLDPGKIVRDMYEAYERINLHKNNYGCFMLGPSATADIGAYMVHGAQGARSLAVLFM